MKADITENWLRIGRNSLLRILTSGLPKRGVKSMLDFLFIFILFDRADGDSGVTPIYLGILDRDFTASIPCVAMAFVLALCTGNRLLKAQERRYPANTNGRLRQLRQRNRIEDQREA